MLILSGPWRKCWIIFDYDQTKEIKNNKYQKHTFNRNESTNTTYRLFKI